MGRAQRLDSSPTPAYADNETPGGSINGSNTVFTLTQAPVPPASLMLFLNGVLQLQGTDYILSGSTITFTNAPTAGAWIEAFYRF